MGEEKRMIRIGDRKQFWSGLTFFGIGVGALIALPSDIGTATRMGPGYFPLLLGACLILFGAGSMIAGLRSHERIWVGRLPATALICAIGGVLLFAALITRAGLAVSLLCLVLASCWQRLLKAPLEVAVIYLVLLLLTWLVFIDAIQLPIEVF